MLIESRRRTKSWAVPKNGPFSGCGERARILITLLIEPSGLTISFRRRLDAEFLEDVADRMIWNFVTKIGQGTLAE